MTLGFKEVIKLIYRFIVQLFIFLAITLPLQLISLPILFIYCLLSDFCPLPSLLQWFDNYHHEYKDGWLNNFLWLAIRNPLNMFQYTVLGLEWRLNVFYIILMNLRVGDDEGPGFKYIEVMVNQKKYYEYYYVHKWSQTKCFVLRFGWKIVNTDNLIPSISQWVFDIRPYVNYTGV